MSAEEIKELKRSISWLEEKAKDDIEFWERICRGNVDLLKHRTESVYKKLGADVRKAELEIERLKEDG